MRRLLRFTLICGLLYLVGCMSAQEKAEKQIRQGHEQADQHQWEKALQHYQQAVKLDSTSYDAWRLQGTAYLNTGQPGQALQSYRGAKAIKADDPYLYCSMASAYHRLQQPEKALHAAEEALTIDASFAPAIANKAKALQALGDSTQSDSLFKKAFRLQPELKAHFK